MPDDADVLLVVDDPGQLWGIYWKLLRIGYREPVGWLAGGMQAWRTPRNRWARSRNGRPDNWTATAVRRTTCSSWTCASPPNGMLATSRMRSISPAANLPGQLEGVPQDRPVAVYCGSGYRVVGCGQSVEAQRTPLRLQRDRRVHGLGAEAASCRGPLNESAYRCSCLLFQSCVPSSPADRSGSGKSPQSY